MTAPAANMYLKTPSPRGISPLLFLLMLFVSLQMAVSQSDDPELPRERKTALRGKKPESDVKDYSSQRTTPFKTPAGRNPSRPRQPRRPSVRSEQPNIIVILTDDQDVLLGSLKYMPKVQNLLIRQGVYFNNSFVPTPMCCPSRSSFLTGMYPHNHDTYTNNANCSSPEWQKNHEPNVFSTYLNETHATGYFGKYLNEYDGNHIPPGWQRWVGLIKNSRFYNYSVVDELGVKTRHDDNYYTDYLTDLLANKSRAFLHDSKKKFPSNKNSLPVGLYKYGTNQNSLENKFLKFLHLIAFLTTNKMTPAWNYAPNPDKQWLLQYIYPMIPQYKIFTDLLQRRRLQTLQSVDDLVESLVEELDMLGELDNTYIIYTSDHGYHLGQFGLIKGKAMPFDFDTRVPLIMRGPRIRPGTIISNIVNNVDIAPTVIELGRKEAPSHMDGESIVKLLKAAEDPKNVDNRGFVNIAKKPWRDTILFERGKLTEKMLKEKRRSEELTILNQAASAKQMDFYIPSHTKKLTAECSRKEYQLPCKPSQKWYCQESNGVLKKLKCSNNKATSEGDAALKDQPISTHPCSCRQRKQKKLSRAEQKNKQFRKRHASHDANHKARSAKIKRSTDVQANTLHPAMTNASFRKCTSMLNRRCRILTNQSVVCDLDIYQKASEWENHKEIIDDMIKEYRKALEDLRDIRRHLREQRPLDVAEEGGDMDKVENELDEAENCECDEQGNIVEPKKKRKSDNGGANQEAMIREERRRNRRIRRKRKNNFCNMENMNCFTHDNDHWKTPPYWIYGPFCFCSNANNNTYWCLRTINQTHDFLYCEFITTFMSFYDLRRDPHQLKNVVTELNYGLLQQLHEELHKLKHCKTSKDCYVSSTQKNRLPQDPQWPGKQYQTLQKKYIDKFAYNYADNDDDVYDDDEYDTDPAIKFPPRVTQDNDYE
ncbi:unnamed protein product [Lymnaea stagnalis]|uniref:Uncharacterized protein n=1 Tax=Lymnaea stagnalis TaxID=6523 RepID=A0AAV2HU10_LYMST